MLVDLLRAMALMLVLEGLVPFLAPEASKRAYGRLASLPDGWLRRAGLVAMLAGAASLQLIHWAA